MSEKIMATWDISLTTKCPKCEEYINLVDIDDFWGGRCFEACEYGTNATTDYQVICPECEHEFVVDFQY